MSSLQWAILLSFILFIIVGMLQVLGGWGTLAVTIIVFSWIYFLDWLKKQ